MSCFSEQGKAKEEQFVRIHGCGGVVLSAIMIVNSLGVKVIGIDINPSSLELAKELVAIHTINPTKNPNLVEQIKSLTGGGAHVSIEA